MEEAYQTIYDFAIVYLNPVEWFDQLYLWLQEGWEWFMSLFLSEAEVAVLTAEKLQKSAEEAEKALFAAPEAAVVGADAVTAETLGIKIANDRECPW